MGPSLLMSSQFHFGGDSGGANRSRWIIVCMLLLVFLPLLLFTTETVDDGPEYGDTPDIGDDNGHDDDTGPMLGSMPPCMDAPGKLVLAVCCLALVSCSVSPAPKGSCGCCFCCCCL